MSEDSEGKRPPPTKRPKASQAGQFPMHEHIGRSLKAMFDQVLEEPVPDKLSTLLEELERKHPKK